MEHELKKQNVTVLGLGARTGVSLVRYLCAQGAHVTAYDRRPEAALQNEVAALRGCTFRLDAGRPAPEGLNQADLILLSPGISAQTSFLESPRKRGIPIWSEIEFASRQIKAPILAITGTNGKSTTTSLLGHILSTWKKRVFVGGNLGTPLMEAVHDSYDYVVAEISSFQLEAVETFHPHVGLLLNVSPNHLDRHRNMETYLHCKEQLFARMTREDHAFLNADDEISRSIKDRLHAQVHLFSAAGCRDAQIVLRQGSACWTDGPKVSLRGFSLFGKHNEENALAATGMALAVGCPTSDIEAALTSFEPLPHRLQEVGRKGQVRFVNDSKSTTPMSTQKALEAFSQPVVWLAGGRAKVDTFKSLEPAVKAHVKHQIFFGECAELMARDLGTVAPTTCCPKLEDAFHLAVGKAEGDDVILLSPANASFDQFSGFEARGSAFAQLVSREVAR